MALTRVEINLSNLIYNINQINKIVGQNTRLLPVLKSNAYGHGLIPICKTIVDENNNSVYNNIFGFGVINMSEVTELRQNDITKPVLVLGPIASDEIEAAIENKATLILYDISFAKEISHKAMKKNLQVPVHIKVDTGLGRLSVNHEKAPKFIEELLKLPGLRVEGLYTHLADAEGIDQSYTLRQLIRFNKLLENLENKGIHIPIKHMAGSAAAMLLPETRFDIARIGISLYGLWPAEETKILMIAKGQNLLEILSDKEIQSRGVNLLAYFLRPVMQFKTTVVQVKEIPPGNCIGYGCTYETRRLTKVAILPAGYAEGIDRKLSNCGEVLIRGKKASIIGRICMNLTIVDITDIPDVSAGDEVVLIGKQGDQEITAEDMADKVGTINYEIVTRINWQVPRVYIW